MRTFHSTGHRPIRGGTIYFVKNDRDCETFDHLIGQRVLLDGQIVTVAGVDTSEAVHKLIPRGQRIGLFVAG